MTDNVFGDRVALREEAAWHQLGTVFQGDKTSIEALDLGDLDYSVFTVPHPVVLDGVENEEPIEIDTGRVAIVRGPTEDDPEHRVLGYAGADYEVVSNREIAELLEPLSQEWPVETAGALGSGERVFFTLRTPEVNLFDGIARPHTKGAGDEILRRHFMVTEGKTGGDALRIKPIDTRVVCQNTLEAAMAESGLSISIPHTANILRDTEFYVNLFKRLRDAQDRSLKLWQRLATKKVVDNQVAAILEAAYPNPKPTGSMLLLEAASDLGDMASGLGADKLARGTKVHKYYTERTGALRSEARELLDRLNDEHPVIANTAYAVYNAVAQFEDHREGRESRFESAMFGVRAAAKGRALKAALSA